MGLAAGAGCRPGRAAYEMNERRNGGGDERSHFRRFAATVEERVGLCADAPVSRPPNPREGGNFRGRGARDMSAGPRSILRGWVWLFGLLLLSSSTAGGLPSRPASTRTFIGLGSSRGATFAITRRVLLAHGAAALLLPATAPAATMTNGVQIFDVASAALDRRAYRGLVLANGMRVLLASDPAAGKAAAAMNVQVRGHDARGASRCGSPRRQSSMVPDSLWSDPPSPPPPRASPLYPCRLRRLARCPTRTSGKVWPTFASTCSSSAPPLTRWRASLRTISPCVPSPSRLSLFVPCG